MDARCLSVCFHFFNALFIFEQTQLEYFVKPDTTNETQFGWPHVRLQLGQGEFYYYGQNAMQLPHK